MISFYIHIPFCVKKCDYCDFLSFQADEGLRESYVRALCIEIASYADSIDDKLYSVFFGGGTPSLLSPTELDMIMDTIGRHYTLTDDAEISLECNPGTVSQDKLSCYRESGVNRLSIGMQSSVDAELKLLGRIHTHSQFEQAYEYALRSGYDNINIDIMSAIPGQSIESYKRTLTDVVNHDPKHISAYSLIIEEGTKFHDLYDVDSSVIDTQSDIYPPLPDEDTEREMYYMTRDILSGYGYDRYEISNYSKAGYECRHNNVYWTGGEYIGFGIGAASYTGGIRYSNADDITLYIQDPAAHIYKEYTRLTPKDMMAEYMYLGLRRMEGVSLDTWREHFGSDMRDTYGEVLDRLISDRLMLLDGDRLRLTDRGIDVSNLVFSNFLLD